MIKYLREVEQDLAKLPRDVRVMYDQQIEKLKRNIYLGQALTSNLSDCRKIYFGNHSEYRIIYLIKGSEVCIVVAVGERNDLEVYKLAAGRLNRRWV